MLTEKNRTIYENERLSEYWKKQLGRAEFSWLLPKVAFILAKRDHHSIKVFVQQANAIEFASNMSTIRIHDHNIFWPAKVPLPNTSKLTCTRSAVRRAHMSRNNNINRARTNLIEQHYSAVMQHTTDSQWDRHRRLSVKRQLARVQGEAVVLKKEIEHDF